MRKEILGGGKGRQIKRLAFFLGIWTVFSFQAGNLRAESPASSEKAETSTDCHLALCETDPRLSRSATKFSEIIAEAAEAYGVKAELIRAIIHAESAFNPKAESHRGARGLMQLMPATARSLGVSNRFDPEQNIMAGTRYFRQLLDRVDGKVNLALAAYNAGMRNVRKYGGVPPFRVTRKYVRNVLDYYEVFLHFSRSGIRQS